MKSTFTVDPSPLNAVKFELSIILVSGILLFLVQDRFTEDLLLQFLLLSGYGVLGMLWIIFRSRRVMRKISNSHEHSHDGAKQK